MLKLSRVLRRWISLLFWSKRKWHWDHGNSFDEAEYIKCWKGTSVPLKAHLLRAEQRQLWFVCIMFKYLTFEVLTLGPLFTQNHCSKWFAVLCIHFHFVHVWNILWFGASVWKLQSSRSIRSGKFIKEISYRFNNLQWN